jgi:hypothetical protein
VNLVQAQSAAMPVAKMPGHWLLARLGKRVLRPGGIESTRRMLHALDVTASDRAVEFAPGLGETAQLVLPYCGRYIGVDRDVDVDRSLSERFAATGHASFIHASADNTGLDTGSATVLWGEAMLSMQPATQKERTVREAARLLAPRGRYGIHELCLTPDGIDTSTRRLIQRELSLDIHVGVQPATESEWRTLLEQNGFRVARVVRAPMHLLEPARLFQDEGLGGVLHILYNAARDPEARRRALAMKRLFRKFERHLSALCLIAIRQAD